MDAKPNMFDIGESQAMTDVDLNRIDPALNMRRFYRMSLQPDLFGGVDLIREWGRTGRRGQSLVERHRCEKDAIASMHALAVIKRKRGYGPSA